MAKFYNKISNKIINETANEHNQGNMIDAMRYAAMASSLSTSNCHCSIQHTTGLPDASTLEPYPGENFAVFVEGNWNIPSAHEPKQIIYSGNRTIVMWADGTKTVVKCAKGQKYDEYSGFVAALAKKMFGSTNHVKKVIDSIKFVQPEKVKKPKNSDEAEE